eukprot:TRINITY_DN7611_c0_g1_i1.p1 TRINITY_DN7611_c0_g1~~TRINITY_DN7611_c0_g1_i1.p1  ORF type:complete len:141 (+),score=50.08 TRINITY_DN7611_c0_g1_i1:89-511(+)
MASSEQSSSPKLENAVTSPDIKTDLGTSDEIKARLQNKLLLRVSKEELVTKNILMSDSSLNISAMQKSLQNKLDLRPNIDDLKDRNIIKKSGEGLSVVEMRLKGNLLSRRLSQRPTRERLIEQKILDEEENKEENSTENQ